MLQTSHRKQRATPTCTASQLLHFCANILLLLLIVVASSAHADIMNPMDYDGSEERNSELFASIEAIGQRYCPIENDPCKQTDLDTFIKRETDAFLSLRKSTDRKTLDDIIFKLCANDTSHCNYSTLKKEYEIALAHQQ
ncbi:hypothetical protein D3C76_93880 [compost metagenome]